MKCRRCVQNKKVNVVLCWSAVAKSQHFVGKMMQTEKQFQIWHMVWIALNEAGDTKNALRNVFAKLHLLPRNTRKWFVFFCHQPRKTFIQGLPPLIQRKMTNGRLLFLIICIYSAMTKQVPPHFCNILHTLINDYQGRGKNTPFLTKLLIMFLPTFS